MFSVQERASLLLTAKRSVAMRAAAKRDNTPVHRAADAGYKAMMLAVSYGFMKGKRAYKSGGVDAAVKAIRAALLESLPPVLIKTFVAGGNAGVGMLPKRRAAMRALAPQSPFGIRFDQSSPEAIAWAKKHAGELAVGISDTTEQRIKDAVAAALEGDGLDAAYEDILAAVGDSDRADLIARNEVMTASNEGNRESMRQAVDEGLLPSDTKMEWIGTSGMCDDCAELDGTTRDIDGEYEGDGGDGPPLHVNCRCTEGISAGGGE